MLLVLDGCDPLSAMSYGERTKSRLMAATVFMALAMKTESGALGEAMACLWMGTQGDRGDTRDGGSEKAGGEKMVAAAGAAAAVASRLEPPPIPTVEPSLAAVVDPNSPIPDVVAKSITNSVRSAVKANGGKAVSLSPALKQAFGAMAAAQTLNFLESTSVSNVIDVPDAHDNHKRIKVVVLPSASQWGNLDDEKKKGESLRYRKFGCATLDAMPPAAQVAVTIRACDHHANVIRKRLGEASLGDFRLSDIESDAVGVFAGLTSTQEKKINRAMNHARGVRFFSPVDKRKKKAKKRLALKSAKFDKVKLKERVKSSRKGKMRDRFFRRYTSSLFEVLARNAAELDLRSAL